MVDSSPGACASEREAMSADAGTAAATSAVPANCLRENMCASIG
jgi:hypothetical protein